MAIVLCYRLHKWQNPNRASGLRNATVYHLRVEIVPKKAVDQTIEEKSSADLICEITEVVQKNWERHDLRLMDNAVFEKIAHEYARQHLESELRKGKIQERYLLKLGRETKEPCRFDPDKVSVRFDDWYEVRIESKIGFRQ